MSPVTISEGKLGILRGKRNLLFTDALEKDPQLAKYVSDLEKGNNKTKVTQATFSL